MGRSYDDEYGFPSQDFIAAAIMAENLAAMLHAPDVEDLEPLVTRTPLGKRFRATDAAAG